MTIKIIVIDEEKGTETKILFSEQTMVSATEVLKKHLPNECLKLLKAEE